MLYFCPNSGTKVINFLKQLRPK